MGIEIQPLAQSDLAEARRIFSLAFGTFIGLDEPESFRADVDHVTTRWRADPSAAFAATVDGRLVGSNFATRWGSVGLFGPLTVHPEHWDGGVAKRLMEPVLACFERWGVRHCGLFTFADSPKHFGLYSRYGFWPRSLAAVMVRPVAAGMRRRSRLFGAAADAEREGLVAACSRLTSSLYEGLDLEREILSVASQGLGDTVLLSPSTTTGGDLDGFAVCHCGRDTEAGTGRCYVKFGAVRPGEGAEARFRALLDACEDFAASRGLRRLEVGVSLAREEACRTLVGSGFRTVMQGVTMHRPNEPAYSRRGMYVLDDWR